MAAPQKAYKPSTCRSQSWEFIEKRYSGWDGKYINMLELVRHIKNSDLSKRLFGSTSLDKLIISIYENLDYQKEALHITFNINSNEWHFKYFAVPFKDPEFVRTYTSDVGIEKFDSFIKMIKW